MQSGQILGRYKLHEKLGESAFGETFLAEQVDAARRVVVKVVSPDQGETRSDAKRFLRIEVLASSQLVSPHIARIFDFGEIEGRIFLAREFVEGPLLSEAINRAGGIPTVEAISVLRGLAEGLSVAHHHGIIHRDLKPSNIVLRRGDFTEPVLLDFGVSGTLNRLTRATVAGQVFGTLGYMSPEQVMGFSQTPATDIYGLGVLFYEMLFGRTPFRAENQYELLANIVQEPIDFRSVSAVPPSVQRLISRCLEKNAANRPQTAEELIQEIDSISAELSGWFAPVSASAPALPGPPAASMPTARRLPFLLLASVSALLLLAFVVTLTTRHATPPGPPKSLPPPPVMTPAPARPEKPRGPVPVDALLWAGVGAIVAAGAFPLGFALRRWLRKRKNHIDEKATQLLFGARSRKELTATLAIEVDKLVTQLDKIDERIVGVTIAIMVDEFRRARKADERQKALMQVIELTEKIRYRLTPWYVRHDKLIAIVVSVLTCVSGLTTAVTNIYRSTPHP